jgi:hypothetical protein
MAIVAGGTFQTMPMMQWVNNKYLRLLGRFALLGEWGAKMKKKKNNSDGDGAAAAEYDALVPLLRILQNIREQLIMQASQVQKEGGGEEKEATDHASKTTPTTTTTTTTKTADALDTATVSGTAASKVWSNVNTNKTMAKDSELQVNKHTSLMGCPLLVR